MLSDPGQFFQPQQLRNATAVVEDEEGVVTTRGDHRHDLDVVPVGQFQEALAAREDDFVPVAPRAQGLDVAAGIDQRRAATFEDVLGEGVGGRGHGEFAGQSAQDRRRRNARGQDCADEFRIAVAKFFGNVRNRSSTGVYVPSVRAAGTQSPDGKAPKSGHELTLRVFAFRDACEERARQSEGKTTPSLKN